jgi:hypothetical protein
MKFSNKFVVVVVAVEMKDDVHIHTSYVAAVAVERDTTYIYIIFSFPKIRSVEFN